MPERRLRVRIHRRRLYVDAEDYVALLRTRAREYRQRAEELIDASLNPGDPLAKAEGGDVVTILDEALACRMVAEELEQRADFLAAL